MNCVASKCIRQLLANPAWTAFLWGFLVKLFHFTDLASSGLFESRLGTWPADNEVVELGQCHIAFGIIQSQCKGQHLFWSQLPDARKQLWICGLLEGRWVWPLQYKVRLTQCIKGFRISLKRVWYLTRLGGKVIDEATHSRILAVTSVIPECTCS